MSEYTGISVVMAAYNAESTICEAARSVLSQDGGVAMELIVVDDASTDRTKSCVQSLGDQRVVLMSLEANVGRAEARNLGVARARYPLIAILDADDVALPGRLVRHAKDFEEHPSIWISSGQLIDILPNGKWANPEYRFPTSTEQIDRGFTDGTMPIAHPASAFRKDWFSRVGGYDPDIRWCEDFDLLLRGWQPGRYYQSSQALTAYRRRTSTTSWNYWWENDRHHRAVLSRARSKGASRTFEDHVRQQSRFKWKLRSMMVYLRYRLKLIVAGQRRRAL